MNPALAQIAELLAQGADPALFGGTGTNVMLGGGDDDDFDEIMGSDRIMESRHDPGEIEVFNPSMIPSSIDVGAGARALPGAPMGAKPPQLGQFEPPRISTRFPTAVKRTEDPLTQQLSIGLGEFKASDPGILRHNAGLLAEYPGFRRLQGRPPEEIAEGYVDQTAKNLRAVMKAIPDDIQERSSKWYDGANVIAHDWAKQYGLPPQSTAGAIAAMSPQKDWFQNVSLGHRVINTVMTQGNTAMTPRMVEAHARIPALSSPANLSIFQRIKGKRLSDIEDPIEQAMWVRLWDEGHNPRGFNIISPEGRQMGPVRSAQGKPSRVAWGSLTEIAKAIGSIRSGGDINIISPLMGDKHKVRNFFNNMLNPNEPRFGDVTADTHAVAVNQLRPLSGNTAAVAHNFQNSLAREFQTPDFKGARGSAVTGVHGTYGANVEPYRRVGAKAGLLPRQVQSITWEGGRGLFTDLFKTAQNMAKIDNIWKAYDDREITFQQAQRAILKAAGGIDQPSWAGSPGP